MWPLGFPGSNSDELSAAVIDSGKHEGLTESIDAVDDRSWFRPVAEAYVVAAHCSGIHEYTYQDSVLWRSH